MHDEAHRRPVAARGTRRWAAGLGVVALTVYAGLIWLDWPPPAGTRYPSGASGVPWWAKTQALRGWGVYPEGWSWRLVDPAPLLRWLPLLALGLLAAVLLYRWDRSPPRTAARTAVALGGLVLLAYGLQLAALWLKHPNANQLLLDRITDRAFTGYFNTALDTPRLDRFFVGYADALARTDAGRLCGHCRTHPPGPILYYWLPLQAVGALPAGVQQGLASTMTAALQVTPPALPPAAVVVAILGLEGILAGAALIVIPLYGLARLLAGPRHALLLAALGLVIPGMILMTPEFDQIFGTLAATLFYLAVRGLRGPHAGAWGWAAGLFLAGCLYWSFGLLVLGLPLTAMGLVRVVPALRRGRSAPAGQQGAPRRVLAWAIGLLAGAVLPWLALWIIGQFDLPRVLQITSQAHLQGITVRRPYGPWALFDLVDFLQFAGLPLALVSLWMLAPATRRRPNLYGLLFWGVLLALDASGTARAEVGRLWIFLVPLALMGVDEAVRQQRLNSRVVGALLGAQFVVCLAIGGRWMTP